jgi:hypothetical protein
MASYAGQLRSLLATARPRDGNEGHLFDCCISNPFAIQMGAQLVHAACDLPHKTKRATRLAENNHAPTGINEVLIPLITTHGLILHVHSSQVMGYMAMAARQRQALKVQTFKIFEASNRTVPDDHPAGDYSLVPCSKVCPIQGARRTCSPFLLASTERRLNTQHACPDGSTQWSATNPAILAGVSTARV